MRIVPGESHLQPGRNSDDTLSSTSLVMKHAFIAPKDSRDCPRLEDMLRNHMLTIRPRAEWIGKQDT